MTVEELRHTAKSMGYNILPINSREKLAPCTCGYKKRQHWFSSKDGVHYEHLVCAKCGKEAKGKTEAEARRNWNKMIKEDKDGC